jgi:hypothetical protein
VNGPSGGAHAFDPVDPDRQARACRPSQLISGAAPVADAHLDQCDAAPSTIAWLQDNMRPALERLGDQRIGSDVATWRAPIPPLTTQALRTAGGDVHAALEHARDMATAGEGCRAVGVRVAVDELDRGVERRHADRSTPNDAAGHNDIRHGPEYRAARQDGPVTIRHPARSLGRRGVARTTLTSGTVGRWVRTCQGPIHR